MPVSRQSSYSIQRPVLQNLLRSRETHGEQHWIWEAAAIRLWCCHGFCVFHTVSFCESKIIIIVILYHNKMLWTIVLWKKWGYNLWVLLIGVKTKLLVNRAAVWLITHPITPVYIYTQCTHSLREAAVTILYKIYTIFCPRGRWLFWQRVACALNQESKYLHIKYHSIRTNGLATKT